MQPSAAGGYGPPNDQFPQYTQPEQQQYNDQGQQINPQPGYAPQPGSNPQGGYTPQDQHGQQNVTQPPQQPQYGPQGGYQDPLLGQFPPHPQSMGMPAYAQGTMQCRFCGSVPAVNATVRGHQGLLILMRFLKLQGPFCRTCGIATVREMTSKSLWQGWWGVGSSIINPITMLTNIGPWSKFKNLPEPAPGAPGRPMDPGKPLFKRPAMLMLLLPVAVIGLIVWGNMGNPSSADVGQCVLNKGNSSAPNVEVVDCGSSDAQYRIIGRLENSSNADDCEKFEGYTAAYTKETGSSSYTLCLTPV
ncbi:LppU/SCO3897 family protein [Kribbella alba]|uniref:LppU/SCO3897 family protein n=1 Tax=Kribbella alba TaxID=190197 RepID=UPI0031DE3CAD